MSLFGTPYFFSPFTVETIEGYTYGKTKIMIKSWK